MINKKFICLFFSIFFLLSSSFFVHAATDADIDSLRSNGSTSNTSFEILKQFVADTATKAQILLDYESEDELAKQGLICFNFSFFSSNYFHQSEIEDNLKILDKYSNVFDIDVFTFAFEIDSSGTLRYMYSVSCISLIQSGIYSIKIDWLDSLTKLCDFDISCCLTYFPDFYNYKLIDKFNLGTSYSDSDDVIFSQDFDSNKVYFGFSFSEDLWNYEFTNVDYYYCQGGRRGVGVFSVFNKDHISIKYSTISTFMIYEVTSSANYTSSDNDNQSTLSRVFNVIMWLPNKIVELFKELLSWLFVPSDDFFEDKFKSVNDKFGFYDSFFDCWNDFIDKVDNFSTSPPKVEVDLTVINSQFNWGDKSFVIDMSFLSPYIITIHNVLSAIAWTFFLWRSFMNLSHTVDGHSVFSDPSVVSDVKTFGRLFNSKYVNDSRTTVLSRWHGD